MIITPECLLTVSSVKKLRGVTLAKAIKAARAVNREVCIHLRAKGGPLIDIARPVPELRRELGPVFLVSPNGSYKEV